MRMMIILYGSLHQEIQPTQRLFGRNMNHILLIARVEKARVNPKVISQKVVKI